MRWLLSGTRVVFISVVAFLSVTLYAFGRARTLVIRDPERRRSAVAHLRGRLLRWSMATLGATFIKMGQVMSTRRDLFSPELIDELRKLQDRLPPFSPRKARRLIETELGGPIDARFSELDPQPVAAASVAQVHRGRLVDGDEVAVKVLRPNVRRRVDTDAGILLTGARVLAWHPHIRLSDPVGHLEEFVDGIRKQTDLTLEALNYQKFHDNFADFEGVDFPRVYPELSTERVMTMEFVRGTKVDELPEGHYEVVGKRLQQMFLKMCFEDGFLHADLHPGNLVITENNEVRVFDVGLVKQLDEQLMEEFIDFNRCLAMGDADDVVNHLRTYHTYLDDVDWDEVRADIVPFIAYFRSQNLAELELGELINRIFALGRKHRVRPRTDMTLILVGSITAEGIGKMLNPHVNSFEEMGKFLMPLVASMPPQQN